MAKAGYVYILKDDHFKRGVKIETAVWSDPIDIDIRHARAVDTTSRAVAED